ncbi:transcriptional regulator family: Fungal Specific TF [Paecilomyces variotii]|nr:transcriptional regulator family: Fungal Specific TF [Paecilomyces variotii]KAJ9332167.1 transcriptional regulator family: Fungal Specific TF [Paecilomyces variotii]
MTSGRSAQGCWTCRLRRKKCDEATPVCFSCDSRNIRCHGYGQRPEWMDGGERERAELARIKQCVKKNRRQKRLRSQQLHSAASPQTPPLTGSDQHITEGNDNRNVSRVTKTGPDRREDLSPTVSHPPESPLDPSSHNADGNYNGEYLSLIPEVNTPNCPAKLSLPARSPSQHHLPQSVLPPLRILHHRETELLMHYLDHVFHLQFRFHSPSVRTGGRGWLLWLLIRTGPLYHAALSLSALHQHVILHRKENADSSGTWNRLSPTLHELNEYHGRTLQELQICLQTSQMDTDHPDLGRQVEILACGVQLISFQLFQGGVSDWQMHVNAVAALISSIEDHRQSQLEHSPDGEEPHTSADPFSAPSPEEAALHFLSAVVIWFDIAACVSTGTAPRLLHHHPSLLGSGRIDLANVMGCRSWAMETIGQIAALSAWKQELVTDGRGVSIWELVEKGKSIQSRLESEIGALEAETVTEYQRNSTRAVQSAITYAFACGALVYLHVTVSGAYPSLPEIKSSVSQTLSALYNVVQVSNDPQSIRGVVWPLCVAGCMVDLETGLQEEYRHLILDMGDDAREFGNTSTVLSVMEKCWEMRQTHPKGDGDGPWDWRRAMECLGVRAFLI